MSTIKTLLQDGVDHFHFPGAQYAVVRTNQIVELDHVGFKERYPKDIPNTGNEVYDCASLTKVIVTTTLIMKLIEQKKLTLKTTITTILPRFKHSHITIYELLTHTSKLPADIINAKRLKNRQEVEEYIYNVALLDIEDCTIVYSDIGFIILGFVIEQVTGETLDVLAEKWIFNPLHMDHTSFHPNTNLAAPTEYREDTVYTGYLRGLVHDEKAFAMNGVSGHAGLFSTVKDLSKFIQMILQKQETILSKETMQMLFVPQVENQSENRHIIRSLGWDKPTQHSTAGDYVSFKNTILHTGFTGCNIWIDQLHGIGFVMLSNAVHPKRSMNQIILYRHTIGNMIFDKQGGYL